MEMFILLTDILVTKCYNITFVEFVSSCHKTIDGAIEVNYFKIIHSLLVMYFNKSSCHK